MATGDAMNVAARLEQQAEPGEVVVGARRYEQVRDLVEAEPLGELALRGHEARVPAGASRVAAEVGRPRGVPGLRGATDRPRRGTQPRCSTPHAVRSMSARRSCSRSSAAGRGQEPPHPRGSRRGWPAEAGRSAAGACPTARASPTGRWPRSCEPGGIDADMSTEAELAPICAVSPRRGGGAAPGAMLGLSRRERGATAPAATARSPSVSGD